MLAKTRVDKPAGAGLWACDDTDATVSGSGERWISDSGATENMTPDPTGFKRYETAPPGRTVEMGDGTLLPVAGYGDLRLKIEQDDADGGQTRDLLLRRAAHVPGLRHNLLSAAQLSATFEHPMQLWPQAAVFRCQRDGQSVIFRKSARRLFEATARRSAILIRPQQRRWWCLSQRPLTSCCSINWLATLARTSRVEQPRWQDCG